MSKIQLSELRTTLLVLAIAVALVKVTMCVAPTARQPTSVQTKEFSDKDLDFLLARRKATAEQGMLSLTPKLGSECKIPMVVLDSPSRTVRLPARQVTVQLNVASAAEIGEALRDFPETDRLVIHMNEPSGDACFAKYDAKMARFFESIGSLPRLQLLHFHACNGMIRDEFVRSLTQCKSLQHLDLGDVSRIDVRILEAFTRLESLNVADCSPNVFEALARLPRIKVLFVRRPNALGVPIEASTAAHIAKLDGKLESFGVPLSRPVHPSLVRALTSVRSLKRLEVEDIQPPIGEGELHAIGKLPNLMALELMLPHSHEVAEKERMRLWNQYGKIKTAAAARARTLHAN